MRNIYTDSSLPQISTAILRGLRLPFAEYQIDMDGLLKQCEIDPLLIDDEDAFIPLSKYLTFLETSAQQRNDPLFSFRLARSSGPETLGAIGFLFLSSPTLFEALTNLAKYVNLLQEATNLAVYRDEEDVVWSYEVVRLENLDATQDVQFSVALIYRLVKMYIGRRMENITLYFRHAPIADLANYRQLIDADFSFNADFNGISIPKEMGSLKSNLLDSSLSDILSSMLDKQLDTNDRQLTFRERTESLIFSDFSGELPTAEQVAARLGVSPATIHRRLRLEGAVFRTILDSKTFDIAAEYLSHSQLSITEIALRCGYAESASFTRAFQRITGGKTPSQYRLSNRKKERPAK